MKTTNNLLKKIVVLNLFLAIAGSSFARTYYIYTASLSGNWVNNATWIMLPRLDNVQKDKFIIPASVTVTADDAVNTLGYTDVEIQISGELLLGPTTTLNFSAASKIEIFSTGSINGNGASQVINIGAVQKYVGSKNKTLSGPLFADNTTGISPSGFAVFSSLAVHFLSFNSTYMNDNSIQLKWSTANELNNSRFEIEQSTNGSSWTSIAAVPSVTANKPVNQYSYSVKNINPGFVAFRLKQIDLDGAYKYSAVTVIKRNNSNEMVSIATSGKTVNISFTNAVNGKIQITVTGIDGRTFVAQSFVNPSSAVAVNLSSLPAGTYVVAASGKDQLSTVKKVMIN